MRFTKNKYSAQKIVIDGIKFDSKTEGEYYKELKLLKMAGEIKEIVIQPKCYLTSARILYKPDFLIQDKYDRVWYVDVKGMRTPAFNIKARLWKHYGDAPLRIVKKKSNKFILIEEILSTEAGL